MRRMPPGEPTKLVCFILRGQEYAADIRTVKETLSLRPITRVVLTPRWLSGIINLRGDVLAVIDLGLLIGHDATALTDDCRIIVARCGGKSVGLLADSLADLRSMPLDSLQTPPSTIPDEAASLMCGIATVEDGRALRVLDFERLFESERLRAFERAEGM